MDVTKFQEECGTYGLAAEECGADVVIKKGDKDVLRVSGPEGAKTFTALCDQPAADGNPGVVFGQNLNPSCQEHVEHHAACCARDLTAKWPEPEKPKVKATKEWEKPEAKADPETVDYDKISLSDLHKLASERQIEGRGHMNSKADLVKALEKSDKAKEKADAKAEKEAKV